jgi:hypothetical protein
LRDLLPAPLLGEIPRVSPFDPAVAAEFLSIKALIE